MFDLGENVKDHTSRTNTAKDMRKDIEETYKSLQDAFDILAKLMQELKKNELKNEVRMLYKWRTFISKYFKITLY